MKKLLTIICALSLVTAFSMPAAAIEDIEDNQAGVALLGQTNQAQKGGEIDNDGLDLDTGDIASGNLSGNTTTTDDGDDVNVDVKTGDLLSGNTDDHSNNSTNTSDTDGTDVDVTTGDIDLLSGNSDDDKLLSDNNTTVNTDNSDQGNIDVAVDDINVSDVANDKSENDNDLLDNKEGTIEVSDIANDKSDNSINTDNSEDNDVAVEVAFDDVVDMEGSVAAAALGGFAIGISIDDIELNLATTTSNSNITQNQGDWSNMSANATNSAPGDDAEAEAGFSSSCHSVDADVYDNVGIMGATFSAGHFNNQANMNSVNVTVQY
jgi:hypothetical protein